MVICRKPLEPLPIASFNLPARKTPHFVQRGFTLTEMMVVVLILAVVGTLAWPAYSGYVTDARRTALFQHMATMQIFQEDMRLRTGQYIAGVYDKTDLNQPVLTLQLIGWHPRNAKEVAYFVTTNETSYTVTARHLDGLEVRRTFP